MAKYQGTYLQNKNYYTKKSGSKSDLKMKMNYNPVCNSDQKSVFTTTLNLLRDNNVVHQHPKINDAMVSLNNF